MFGYGPFTFYYEYASYYLKSTKAKRELHVTQYLSSLPQKIPEEKRRKIIYQARKKPIDGGHSAGKRSEQPDEAKEEPSDLVIRLDRSDSTYFYFPFFLYLIL